MIPKSDGLPPTGGPSFISDATQSSDAPELKAVEKNIRLSDIVNDAPANPDPSTLKKSAITQLKNATKTSLLKIAGKIQSGIKNVGFLLKDKTNRFNEETRTKMIGTLKPKSVLKNMVDSFKSQGWNEDLERMKQYIDSQSNNLELATEVKNALICYHLATENSQVKDEDLATMKTLCRETLDIDKYISVLLNQNTSPLEKSALIELIVERALDPDSNTPDSDFKDCKDLLTNLDSTIKESVQATVQLKLQDAVESDNKAKLSELMNPVDSPSITSPQSAIDLNDTPLVKPSQSEATLETKNRATLPLSLEEKNDLKREFISLILKDNKMTGVQTISERIVQANDPDMMNIPKLIDQLPALFPSKTKDEIKSIESQLRKQWITMEAGHEWGININFSVYGSEKSSKGNTSELSAGHGALLVSNFMSTEDAKRLLSPESQEKVIQAALSGAKAAQKTGANFRTNIDLSAADANNSTGKMLLEDLNANGIITIPAGWSTHAVGITLHKAADGKYFLYYCNRGGKGFEKTKDRALMGTKNPSTNMVCFEVTRPEALTEELLGQIAKSGVFHPKADVVDAFSKPFIEGGNGIFKILGLQERAQIMKTPQKTGNCSWANFKGSVHASLIAAAYDESAGNLNQAIASSQLIFKKMERFGRKQGLGPLLEYKADTSNASINTFDHLRILTEARTKLAKKANESGKEASIKSEDAQMRDSVIAFFNQCPYTIDSFNHREIGDRSQAILKEALKNQGEGAFAFVNNQCWIQKGNTIETIDLDPQMNLKDFLNSIRDEGHSPALTFPVFLNKRDFNPLLEAAPEYSKKIRNNLKETENKINKSYSEYSRLDRQSKELGTSITNEESPSKKDELQKQLDELEADKGRIASTINDTIKELANELINTILSLEDFQESVNMSDLKSDIQDLLKTINKLGSAKDSQSIQNIYTQTSLAIRVDIYALCNKLESLN